MMKRCFFIAGPPEPWKFDYQHMLYQRLHEAHFEVDTGIYTAYHLQAFSAKINAADFPRYHEAINSPEQQDWIKAMEGVGTAQKNGLLGHCGSNARHERHIKCVGTTTKKIPDGSIHKLKARFCCRGFEQMEGLDYFQTYSPVVGWATVCLLLTLSVHLNLKTVQVDYTNAFIHAKLDKTVHCKMPQGF